MTAVSEPPPDEIRAETRLVDEGEIATGGMASVHRVVDQQIGRTLAMKVFTEALTRADEEAALRFVQEGQINGQLDHPNIVPVYQLALDGEGKPAFFTMKLVHGRTLCELFAERDLASPSEHELERLLRIVIQVCEAVSFAHSRGVVHLDLKPDNVMVGTHGQVYLMDWGCARLVPGAAEGDQAVRVAAPPAQREGRVMGTFSYMPPEQARGRARGIDTRTDVFALGGILYRLLTHRPPYVAPDYRAVLEMAQRGYVEPPTAVVPTGAHVSAELARITMKALAADKNRRYPTVDDLKADLEAFLRGGTWLARRTYPAGAVIVREGEPGDEAFIVTQGRCEAVKEEGGGTLSLRVMGPGAVFGEAALLASQPRTATVVARDDLSVLVVSRQALEQELCFDSWSGVFVRALAERFRDLDGQLDQARRDEREAGQRQWVREFALVAGQPVGLRRWEVSWAEIVRAARQHLQIEEEALAALVERCADAALDRTRGVLVISSDGGAAAGG
jgi:CRP-like cAMP-binding protein